MVMTTDLTYMTDGMFTRFIADSEAGVSAWNEMASKMNGVAAVLNFEAKSVIAQLRAAGYKVAKAKKCNQSIDSILAELGV